MQNKFEPFEIMRILLMRISFSDIIAPFILG
ncbi:hypothetical protein P781_09505 [Vibrio mimicus CAIM 1883]|nr:hypothetical protein P781_09505 [Vibrio mimicus CAIM 1883]ERM56035.1 hypothetical protein P780_09490 [Vibrio mimicus CAIM 1882]